MDVFGKIISQSYEMFLLGLGTTIRIFVISVSLGFLLGLLVALMRIAKVAPLRWLSTTYVNIIRGTPFMLQLLFIYTLNGFVFAFFQEQWPNVFADLDSRELSGIITIALNAGAYFSEIIRGGIQSIPTGQVEASRSLGLSRGQTMWSIILPQALRTMFPALGNQAIISLKDTSLLTTIGIGELMYQGSLVFSANLQILPTLTIMGVLYFVLIYLLTQLFNLVEKRVKLP